MTSDPPRRGRPPKPKGPPKPKRPPGRPKAALPEELMLRLGEPPDNPLHAAEWWAKLLQAVALGYAQGRPWSDLLRELRATATAVGKLLPDSIKNKALQVMRAQEAEADDEYTHVEEEEAGDDVDTLRVNP